MKIKQNLGMENDKKLKLNTSKISKNHTFML